VSSNFIPPGTLVTLGVVPNRNDNVLAVDLDIQKKEPSNLFSIPWYDYINRMHQVVQSLLTPFPEVILSETGADNAIACPANSGPALIVGLGIKIKLAHILHAGPNTLAYGGSSTAIPIRSHRNPALDIAVAYAVGAIISLVYDGTVFQDLSQ
jgi:hypothetical protein